MCVEHGGGRRCVAVYAHIMRGIVMGRGSYVLARSPNWYLDVCSNSVDLL